ncbi:MAG: tetratricopeptide repeat protein, partial [Deltaproteobacteria bacterium]|nr:tetratricopeptide repeat protein [Deltaproteobacteria bacterium]
MTTSVRIDKFWVGALLGDAYPHFSADKGADLDGNGTIEGKEVFKDFNGDGEVGDREDYKQYLSQNRAALSAKVPFFKWGEKLGVGNRIHQELYFESDLKEAPLLQSAYVFISDLVEKVNAMAEGQNLTPEQESGLYYEEMEKSGIKFRNQKSASLVGNIQNRTLDCDTSSFVAMALGDERGLILKLVRVPNHVFLQGRGKRGPFNMDQGVIEPNIIYEREFDLDSERAKRGDYLSPLEDQKMESLFLDSRGCELTELERYREALAAYDRAIELDSQSAFAHTNRGIVLDKLGRYREALAAYDRAIEL